MATEFGCNVEAVERTATQLRTVVDELKGFEGKGDEFHWALQSGTIEQAVRDFSKDSSDFREKVGGAIEAFQQLLQAVVEGVHAIDEGLANSLPDPDQLKVLERGGRP